MYTPTYSMFSKHIEVRSFETEVCILVFVLPGMERGKGEVTPGHQESVENSESRISGKQRSERKTCAAAPEFGSFGGCTPPTGMFQMNRELPFADTR